MPIFEFSNEDLLRGKIVTPDWYRIRITSVGEKLSKDGGSTNFPVEAVILYNASNGDKTFEGVPVAWNFNSKAKGFAIGFLNAFGMDVTAGQRYELAQTAGKEVEVYIGNKLYENQQKNDVQHLYRPAK